MVLQIIAVAAPLDLSDKIKKKLLLKGLPETEAFFYLP